MTFIEPLTLVALFVVSAVGGLIVWELRKIHTRIDKYAGEMDDHIKEGVQIHKAVARLDMHLENGHTHKIKS